MPNTWPPAPTRPDPAPAQPALPPTKPWAITAATAMITLVLALEAVRHNMVLTAGFGVLLVGNVWAAGQLWRGYLRQVRALAAKDARHASRPPP